MKLGAFMHTEKSIQNNVTHSCVIWSTILSKMIKV